MMKISSNDYVANSWPKMFHSIQIDSIKVFFLMLSTKHHKVGLWLFLSIGPYLLIPNHRNTES